MYVTPLWILRATQERGRKNAGIQSRDLRAELYERVSAAGRPILPSREEPRRGPESIPASRTTRVLFMRVRSYTRRSNKPVAHEVNQCTRPVGTTRRRRAHRFWREIKVARPGDGEVPISTHGKGAKRARDLAR